jgi:SAM-dependent methyltransferase
VSAPALDPREQGYDEDYFQRPYFEAHPGKRRSLDEIVLQLERSGFSGRSVLDVGCGPGFLLRVLVEHGYEASGVDHSQEALRLARERVDGELRQGDACGTLPWPDQSFDAVVLHDVIEHLGEPDHALDEVHRVLRRGGLVLLSTLNERSVLHRILGRRWSFYHDPTHILPFDIDSLTALLDRADFQRIASWTYFDLNKAGETTAWLRPLRSLARVVYVPRWGESITVVARRRGD